MEATKIARKDLSVLGFEPAYQVSLYDSEGSVPDDAREEWRITGARDAAEVLRWVSERHPVVFTVFAEVSDLDGLHCLAFVAGFRPSREARGVPVLRS